VGRAEARLREAAKLGFERAIAPALGKGKKSDVKLTAVERLADAVDRIAQNRF